MTNDIKPIPVSVGIALSAEIAAFRQSPVYVASKALQDAGRIIDDLCRVIESRHGDEDVLDSMAIWEEMLNNKALIEQLPEVGAAEHRQYIIDKLQPFVAKWYEHARDKMDFDDSFDWEFVPRFLGNLRTIIVDDITDDDIAKSLQSVTGLKIKKANKLRRLINRQYSN